MNSRIERNNVIPMKPRPLDLEQLRLDAVAQIARENDRHKVQKIVAVVCLAVCCTLVWGGLLWLATT